MKHKDLCFKCRNKTRASIPGKMLYIPRGKKEVVFTPKDIEIITAKIKGATVNDISSNFNVSREWVYNLIHKANIAVALRHKAKNRKQIGFA